MRETPVTLDTPITVGNLMGYATSYPREEMSFADYDALAKGYHASEGGPVYRFPAKPSAGPYMTACISRFKRIYPGSEPGETRVEHEHKLLTIGGEVVLLEGDQYGKCRVVSANAFGKELEYKI